MKQLEIIFARSEQQEGKQEQEKRKLVLVRKPVALQGKDGRILGSIPRTKSELEEDFWKRVKQGKDDECWEWKAGRNTKVKGRDYGIVRMNGKRRKTHQVAYEIAIGKIPSGMFVCHKCDNPPCCNPKHLFAGTPKDNVEDCFRKGRAYREMGEDRYNARLTESDVNQIRARYIKRSFISGGRALAKEFGVGATMIDAIVKGRKWKHLLP